VVRIIRNPPRTWCIMAASIGVLLGLGGARWRLSLDGSVLITIAILCSVIVRKHKSARLAGLIIIGMVIGLWRGGQFLAHADGYQDLYGRTVTLLVTATSDGYYEDEQYSFDAGSVKYMHDGGVQQLPGKGMIRTQGLSTVSRGDQVQVTGRMYKTRGSRQFGMSYAQGSVVSSHRLWTDGVRQSFSAGVRNTLPEPLASFGLGLLIGQRADLPEGVADDLSRAGLTHIIAVSGYNLTIIVQAVRRRLSNWSKYQATMIAIGLMAVFVLITGFSASIVRACIVSGLSLWAWYYGRPIKPLILVLFPAALTALWNPFYVWSDIGWYLSFLAFFGVLTVAPLWEQRRLARTGRTTIVGQLVREAFPAQLMTIPIIMYIFGRVSVVGLLANVVVVPLVPVAMFVTAVAGFGGMVAPAFVNWLGLPATVLLNYMLDITHVMASFGQATVNRMISAAQMVVMYVCIIISTIVLWKKTPQNAILTDEKGKLDPKGINVRTQQMVNYQAPKRS
jgi:competence protein ComEC